jgi:hypothetical protein
MNKDIPPKDHEGFHDDARGSINFKFPCSGRAFELHCTVSYEENCLGTKTVSFIH